MVFLFFSFFFFLRGEIVNMNKGSYCLDYIHKMKWRGKGKNEGADWGLSSGVCVLFILKSLKKSIPSLLDKIMRQL